MKYLDMPFQIKGDLSGNVTEIDESLFGKKKNYQCGSCYLKVWVFDRTEKNTQNI